MSRRAMKTPDVYLRRSVGAATGMQEARALARGRAVECVRAIEDLFLRVVGQTGVLRGMPVLWGANDQRGALRGVRFRTSLQARGEKLKNGEEAFALLADGTFQLVRITAPTWVAKPIMDEEILAEDAAVAATLACDILERHIRLLDERTVKMVALERWTTKLRDLMNEAP